MISLAVEKQSRTTSKCSEKIQHVHADYHSMLPLYNVLTYRLALMTITDTDSICPATKLPQACTTSRFPLRISYVSWETCLYGVLSLRSIVIDTAYADALAVISLISLMTPSRTPPEYCKVIILEHAICGMSVIFLFSAKRSIHIKRILLYVQFTSDKNQLSFNAPVYNSQVLLTRETPTSFPNLLDALINVSNCALPLII